MKTFAFILAMTMYTLQLSAQDNFPLNIEVLTIKYDTMCEVSNKCYLAPGEIVIQNDTITYNGVKYFVTHKTAKEGIKFFATSTRSAHHQLVVSGDYHINGILWLNILVPNAMFSYHMPIREFSTGRRNFGKSYVKKK